MNRNIGLLAQIQNDALDSTKPLADTLRKCIALGGETGSTKLRDWANLELSGYQGDADDLPAYRVSRGPLQLDAAVGNGYVTGQTISADALPEAVRGKITEEIPLAFGVGELEAMARKASKDSGMKLIPPHGADVVRLMNYENNQPYQQIMALYWHVSGASIAGVLDRIRTALTSLVAEMRAVGGDDQEVPSAQAADQAVSVIIHGNDRGTVNVTTAQAATGGEASVAPPPAQLEQPNGFWTKWRKIGAMGGGAIAIIGTIAGVGEWQNWNPF